MGSNHFKDPGKTSGILTSPQKSEGNCKCMMSDFMLMAQNWNACGICKHYLCIQIIILELEDWLSSNQEVGTSPFLICDFTLLLNTVQSVDRNNLVHEKLVQSVVSPTPSFHWMCAIFWWWSGSSSFRNPLMNMNYMFMFGYAKHLSLLLVGCFINVRWTGWTGPFCCAAILLRFAVWSFWLQCSWIRFFGSALDRFFTITKKYLDLLRNR